jgi:hypothetical protein
MPTVFQASVIGWYLVALSAFFFQNKQLKWGKNFLNKPVAMKIVAIVFILMGIYLLAHIYW